MPDISMCKNDTCPLKNTCYRFIATPNEYVQQYDDFKYDEKSGCDYYWKIDYNGKVERKIQNQK